MFANQKLKAQKYRDTLAAIDLGSNAVRFFVATLHKDELHIRKNSRYPIRLGEDVFSSGEVSEQKILELEEAFIRFKKRIEKYGIKKVRACGTSALRNATNGDQVIERVQKASGIQIERITGEQEADLIRSAVCREFELSNCNILLIDIGGGSTELTLVTNEEIVASRSFPVGSVRLLPYENLLEIDVKLQPHLEAMKEFIQEVNGKHVIDFAVGTGGNLRRIGKLRQSILGKKNTEEASFKDICKIFETLKETTYQQRVEEFGMRKDRADVIMPAIALIFNLMSDHEITELIMPKVGLKDGILFSMLDEMPNEVILWD